MAVLYRVYKDNRENSLTSGQYFARAIHTDTIGLKEMAMEIEENVSVKYSDVAAVLIELVNVMNRHLNASRRVKLDGFGAFKIGLKTKGALRERTSRPPRTSWAAACCSSRSTPWTWPPRSATASS